MACRSAGPYLAAQPAFVDSAVSLTGSMLMASLRARVLMASIILHDAASDDIASHIRGLRFRWMPGSHAEKRRP
jgi:hypothetical protein